MPSSLPVSRLVNVSVNLSPSAAQSQNLSSLLIMGASTVIDTVERVRSYDTLSAVAADFGTTAKEYLAALLWFQQTPQPTQLYIGRWARYSTSGKVVCAPLSTAQQAIAAWNAVTSGGFTMSKNGAAATNITGLNFSAAANLSAVAAIIQASTTNITCVWNASLQRFEIASTTTGTSSSISFLTAPGSGTDVAAMLKGRSTDSGAYLVTGMLGETAAAAVAEMDDRFGQTWYGLVFTETDMLDSEHLAVASYVEAANTKYFYGITTQQAGVLVAATTSDLASQLKAVAYKKTMVQYSSTSPYAVVSAMARILTTEYTGNATVITLMYKQEPGVVAETLAASQVDALAAKNCNVFVSYQNNTNILQNGVTCSGLFVDIVTGTDWLGIAMQTALYNVLYTSPTKIPQTDQGVHILCTTVESVCNQAVINGLLAPGVWQSAGFGTLKQNDYLPKGFYVYAARVDSQSQEDRSARRAPPIQVAAKLAGAVHEVSVSVVVNQ